MADSTVALTGVSATVRQGVIIRTIGPGEGVVFDYPLPTLAMEGVVGAVADAFAIEALLPTLAMVGSAPVPATITLQVLLPSLAMDGVAGVAGELTLRTPQFVFSLGSGAGLDLELPRPTLTMSGVIGGVGQLTLRAPQAGLALTGLTNYAASLAIPISAATLVMAGTSGVAGRFDRTLPKPTLRLTGVVGTHGTLAIESPLPEVQFTGIIVSTGVLTLTGPAVSLMMSGVTAGTAVQVEATRVTYALQTERLALTRYTNYPFNSFAVFGGRYLGASTGGIFELTGDTDNGTAIAAVAQFGITDLGTSRVKRVETVYIGYRTTRGKRALMLRVTTNETQQRDYGVKPAISSGLHTARVELGKGVESRYWQFELRNRDGIDFSVDTVDVAPTPLQRRVGAKDA